MTLKESWGGLGITREGWGGNSGPDKPAKLPGMESIPH